MAIVWIIERSEDPKDSIAAKLMGDYAVRVFASMESFQRLARFNRKVLPDAIVIAGPNLDWGIDRVESTLDYYLPDSLRILVSDDHDLRQSCGQKFRTLSSSLEGMMLSSFLRRALYEANDRRPMHAVMRYRDVVFDAAKSELRTAGGEAEQHLSRKESAILQLLLERPGACVSRETLQEKVWNGMKVAPRNIDSHVSRLRKRLTETEIGIKSIYGGGYMLK